MTRAREGRIRIGTEMPGWLPAGLHAPARIMLGLGLGAVVAGYAWALAMIVDGILAGGPLAWTTGALRLAGLILLAVFLRRWALRRADARR